MFVDGQVEVTVRSPADALRVMARGCANRHVGSTLMNRTSSRSHSVFTLWVEARETALGAAAGAVAGAAAGGTGAGTGAGTGVTKSRFARFNLIDLAGSERQKAARTAGGALAEAAKINRSLSLLGKVIYDLVDVAAGRRRHIHYRDSKLTFLLKDSLGGNSKTCIITNISPAGKNRCAHLLRTPADILATLSGG